MDYSTYTTTDGKNAAMKFLYLTMPTYLSSKHRVHKMFFRKCENEIGIYETCIENPKWQFYYNFRKTNIDQYISASLRSKCYSEWVKVRRCAIKNIGDSFALKLNMTRQIEEPNLDEEDYVIGIERIYDEKANVIKYEKNQFGPPEEEEGEEESEGESEEEPEQESSNEEGEANEGQEAKDESSSENSEETE